MPPTLYDITPPITPSLNVWPGDTPMTREVLCRIEEGASVTLSTLRATVHLGAHADGPNHYTPDGPGIGERSLEPYLGPCQVVHAPGARGRRVGVGDILGGISHITTPRVLIRTDSFPDFASWNADFAALEPSLIDALHERNVITVGVDTPSVDSQDSKDLPAHHTFARHDMSILEGLALAHVPPGVYELIALPLKLIGFDASPIRAVLRTIE
ncbi:MAG: cyclase family protein [Pyrinomonadaceae bacterium]|nr:cyclase family protein [Phycisphaerales bacterium]